MAANDPSGTSPAAVVHDGTGRLLDWAARSMSGRLVAHARLPTVRPAWRIDLQDAGDGTTPYVIRCARPAGFGLSAVYSLAREARILRALARHGMPVPAVCAETVEPEALLLECLSGRSDFDVLDSDDAWKGRVVSGFIQQLVRLHAIPAAELRLDDVVMPPRSTEAHALQELDVWERLYVEASRRPDALLVHTLGWLRAHAPRSPETVLVQGDTGPNQCLFDERGIVAVLDWELAHFGDPMEDLGWIAARSFFARFGDLPGILRTYSRLSGRPLDYDRIAYYRIMALAKCAIATGLARETMGPADDLGSIISWDSITRYALTWSLVQTTGDAVPPLEPDPTECEPLHRTVSEAVRALAAAESAPYEALRLSGLADTLVLLGLDRGNGPPEGGELTVEDAALARRFHAAEHVQMSRLQRAFGPRGRIHLEPLR